MAWFSPKETTAVELGRFSLGKSYTAKSKAVLVKRLGQDVSKPGVLLAKLVVARSDGCVANVPPMSQERQPVKSIERAYLLREKREQIQEVRLRKSWARYRNPEVSRKFLECSEVKVVLFSWIPRGVSRWDGHPSKYTRSRRHRSKSKRYDGEKIEGVI